MADSSSRVQLQWPGRRRSYSERVAPVVLQPLAERSLNPESGGNLIIDGENMSVMSSLLDGSFGLRGKVDLLMWDPPYNTGNRDFRYNDDFSVPKRELAEAPAEPLDEEIDWVELNDPARHAKWLNFMAARLSFGKKLLKNSGVIAVCIDHRELFHLGMLMDEMFGEDNRLGIVNWQKTYTAKPDSRHMSDATEYVLLYEKVHGEAVRQGLYPASEEAAARYSNPDNDPNGDWSDTNPKAKTYSPKADYGIQSPFTGEVFYPGGGRTWRHRKSNMLEWLQDWGTDYVEMEDPNCPSPSLVLKGAVYMFGALDTPPPVLAAAQEKARARLAAGNWPKLIFLRNGEGTPMVKKYYKDVLAGRVPMSFFREEEYMFPLGMGSQGWNHEESGHNKGAREMLNAIMGDNHDFATPKPVQLIEKLIHLYCPPTGVVVDAFGGSGTTAHAVLDLNQQVVGSERRFVLIENGQGSDRYCDSLTAERVRRVITGNWAAGEKEPVSGGFTYLHATTPISRLTLLGASREELTDAILQSSSEIGAALEARLSEPAKYLIGRTKAGEGIALVWDNGRGSLTSPILEEIKSEAAKFGLRLPVYVYALVNQGPNGSDSYIFQQVPDAVLTALGASDT